MGDFICKGLRQKDLSKMRKAFNLAFSNYYVPIHLSHGQFIQKIVEKTSISFKYSVGCYDKKKLVGFIFNSINYFEGKKTAYNGGTGVIADYRGNKLTQKMYESIFPSLRKNGVEQCLLEVITHNRPAIRVYENLGFVKTKYYHCMKLSNPGNYILKSRNNSIQLRLAEQPKWKKYQSFCDYDSCFLDSFPMLKKNMRNESILEAYEQDQLIGFLVFNRKMGRVEHLGVHHDARGRGIGTLLIQKMIRICRDKPIYILNLNERNYDLLNFFLRLGFKNEIDQFELQLPL